MSRVPLVRWLLTLVTVTAGLQTIAVQTAPAALAAPTPTPVAVGPVDTHLRADPGAPADPPAGSEPDPKPNPRPDPKPSPSPRPEPTSSPSPRPTPTAAPTRDPEPTAAPTTRPSRPLGPNPQELAARREAELEAQRAAELAAQQAAAEELARKRAAEAAAKLAAAQQRTAVTWTSRGRPHRMIVVRDLSVETVAGGRLTAMIPRPPGPVTWAALDRMVPAGWVSVGGAGDQASARVNALINLTPGATLDLGGVRTVRLVGGATAADAASIFTGSGRVVGRGVTVTSADPVTGAPMPAGPGRPFLVVAGGGRLEASDVSFTDLGTAANDPDSRAGVQFNPDSAGSLQRVSFQRDTVGLRVAGSRDVRLEQITVRESVADGLVLEGDQGTTLSGVVAERNGANGVLVKGGPEGSPDAAAAGSASTAATTTAAPAHAGSAPKRALPGRVISGVHASGNGEYGLAVVGQPEARIAGLVSTGNRVGGLRLNRATGASVVDLTSTDEPIGVYTHVGSSGLTFERVKIAGSRRGLVLEKSTHGVDIRHSGIDRAVAVGVSIGGHEVQLDDVTVTGSKTGVRVEHGASDVTATGLRLRGGDDGFVANSGSERVALRGLVAEGIGNDAVRTYSAGTTISGARVVGADTGIVASAATTIADSEITEAHVGLRSRGGALTTARRLGIAALTVGVDAAPGSPVDLRESRSHALQAVRGEVRLVGLNDLSLPPLNVLGAIGVPLVLLALLLEVVHVMRQRKVRRPGERPRRPPTPMRPTPMRPALLPAGA